MEEVKSLERKGKLLQEAVGRLSNLPFRWKAPGTPICRRSCRGATGGSPRCSSRAEELGSWKKGAKALGFDTDLLVYRTIPLDELLPWDFIEGGDKSRLVREYRLAFGCGTDNQP